VCCFLVIVYFLMGNDQFAGPDMIADGIHDRVGVKQDRLRCLAFCSACEVCPR